MKSACGIDYAAAASLVDVVDIQGEKIPFCGGRRAAESDRTDD